MELADNSKGAAMTEETQPLNRPWFVAVWPGMGRVAITAGYYMMAKLGMHVLAEFSPRELFEVEHVEVKDGLIRAAPLPRSRCFLWRDPEKKRDLVLFIGEAQPPIGKRTFCHAIVNLAQGLGAERIFTFAAMATRMHPQRSSRVYAAATIEDILADLNRLDVQILQEGTISGLNGVLLGEASEAGLHGGCLLGEMPHIFAQLPFPGASLAVLKVFSMLTGISIDLKELAQRSEELSQSLGEVLVKLEDMEASKALEPEEEEAVETEPVPEQNLSLDQERRIEELFTQASQDRSKAFELKQELDRLDVFHDYEDRFLDLFQKPEE